MKRIGGKKNLRLIVLGAVLLMLMSLSACGGDPSLVIIKDEGMNTEIELNLPMRVDKILIDAEIPLGKNDEVIPSLNTNLNPGETITVLREHTVKLISGGKVREVTIVGGRVSDLLEKEGIYLGENQVTSEPLEKELAEGMEIEILDKLKIAVTADGATKEERVRAGTVEETLEALGISLGEMDRVEPGLMDPVSNGMEIKVMRVTVEEVKENQEIPFETISEPTEAFAKGVEVISREGKTGEKEITYRITRVDGIEESKEIIEEKIVSQPVSEILIVGNYEEPVYEEPYDYPYYDPAYSEAGDEGNWESQEAAPTDSGETQAEEQVYEVSREDIPNCSGDGHGYYHVIYSDGSEDFIYY